MPSGNPALVELIRTRIRTSGPVTFAWFMEQALYHPEHGYYSSGRAEIGRRGDYFTNVSVGPLFGRLMTAQFAEMWKKLGAPNEFNVVEQGAHHGDLARDVLLAARQHHPEFFAALRYRIVEPFPILRARQEATLAEFNGRTEWHDSLENLPPFRGVHFSNELVDAMPIHLVQREDADWKERHVTEEGDEFGFIDLPISNPTLLAQLTQLPNECGEAEINLAALDWIAALSEKLSAGFVVMVDYGYFADDRHRSTLRSFFETPHNRFPWSAIGQADITAHVDWTGLITRAQRAGLTNCGVVDQHHFIAGLLSGQLAAEFENAGDAKTKRALQTLLHPEMLGRKFQFLVLSKNLSSKIDLAGLRFARR